MKLLFHLLAVTLFFLDNGASSVETVSMLLEGGDSVTLHTSVTTTQQEEIKWFLSGTRIGQIRGDLSFICTDVQCNEGTERFRDRLKLDNQTGSLTIMNTRTTDSGEYKLQIVSSSDREKIFSVTVIGVPAAEQVKKSEGESVTLDFGVIKNPNILMMWYFNDTLIAEINEDPNKICTDVQCDAAERFRDRLKLDHQTGSLTITNTRNTDSGLYKLQIIISSSSLNITRVKKYNVTVIGFTDSSLGETTIDAKYYAFPALGAFVGAIVGAFVGVKAAASACGCCGNRCRTYSEAPQNDNDDNLPRNPANLPDPNNIHLENVEQ